MLSDRSQSMSQGWCSSELQTTKAHRLVKTIVGFLLDGINRYIASWKATKAQHQTWPANLWTFPWSYELAELQGRTEHGNGVSINRSACGKQDHWLCAAKFQIATELFKMTDRG